MGHDIKTLRAHFKDKGVFYTDSKLAELLKSFIPNDVTEVYDPTCGDGALLDVFPREVKKYGQEIDLYQAETACKRLQNAVIATGDTLASPQFKNRRFRGIVANPPFSIKWNPEKADVDIFHDCPVLPPAGKADYAFLLHILHVLAPDGVAAILNFPGVCYRGQREGQIRKWMVEQNYIDEVWHIEGGHFVDTKIPTCLLVLRKNRQTTDVRFYNRELKITRVVTKKEIEDNGYNLSVSAYVSEPATPRPQIDPMALENMAQRNVLQNIRAQIEFSKAVAGFEGWSLTPFLDKIQSLVNEYRD